MKLRGNLNALIGVWFIIAPWAIGVFKSIRSFMVKYSFWNYSSYCIFMGL
ncbi:SPW repeat domain-containing protein [Priestia megaterium]